MTMAGTHAQKRQEPNTMTGTDMVTKNLYKIQEQT